MRTYPTDTQKTSHNYNSICFAVLCVMLVTGCAPEERTSEGTIARIIVKFTHTSRPPPHTLSLNLREGAVLLRHERALSGESHLYAGLVSQKTLKRTLRALNERADVDYAQADRKFRY